MIAALLFAQTTMHWGVLVEFGSKPRFAEMADAEAADGLSNAIRDKFALELGKREYEVALVDSAPIRGHESDALAWQKATSGTQKCVLVRLDKWKQKNKNAEEILNGPNKSASETTVELKMWTFEPPFGTLVEPGKQELIGTAGAGYFGTTNRNELSGSPDAKTLEIQNNDKKRMKAIAAAVWNAVADRLGLP